MEAWDWRLGMVTAHLVNTQIGQDVRPRQPWDIFPHLDDRRTVQTPEEQMAIWLNVLGAKDLRDH